MEAAGGKALACVVDIRDEQQIGEAVQKAVDKFGGMTIFTVCLQVQFLLQHRPKEILISHSSLLLFIFTI